MARKITTALAAIAASTSIFAVMRWLRSKSGQADQDAASRAQELVDEADLESFPASDPPAWTLGEDRTS